MEMTYQLSRYFSTVGIAVFNALDSGAYASMIEWKTMIRYRGTRCFSSRRNLLVPTLTRNYKLAIE